MCGQLFRHVGQLPCRLFNGCYDGFGLFFRGRNRRAGGGGGGVSVGALPEQSHSLLFFRLCRGFGKAFGQVVEPVPIGEEIGELIPYHRVCALWRSKVQQAGNVIGMFGQKNIRSFIHPGEANEIFSCRRHIVTFAFGMDTDFRHIRITVGRKHPQCCCIACRGQ